MKIRRFASGAVRSDDAGKRHYENLSQFALDELEEHFSNNQNDFGATNYFKGIKPEDILPSLLRHVADLRKAFYLNDKQAIRDNFRAIQANAHMASHQIVIEEMGLYKEIYDKTELVDKDEYLKTLNNGQ